MEDKICTFFGHRDIELTENLKKSIYNEILKAIEFGCTIFYFGGYSKYDFLCLDIVNEIKDTFNYKITTVYCVSQERFLRKKTPYFDRNDYDSVIYLTPSFDGWYKSIYFRNLAMIDASSYIIFLVEERENSGAYKAYQYAVKQKDKKIVNLL